MDDVARPRRNTGHLLTQVVRECARAQDPLHLLERVSGLVRAPMTATSGGESMLPPSVGSSREHRRHAVAWSAPHLGECGVAGGGSLPKGRAG